MPEELRLIPRSAQIPSPTLRDLVAVFFRHRQLGMIVFATIFLGVTLYGIFAPSYQAEMKVLLRRGRTDSIQTPTLPQSPEFDHSEISEEEVNSEVELLRDKETLSRVARSAGLASEKQGWASIFDWGTDETRQERAVQRLSKKLNVESLRKTTLIGVTYSSSDPEESARVLRCLADAYLQRHVQVRRPSGQFDFFQQQMDESRRNLDEAQLKLMEFTRDQGVVSAGTERDTALQKLSESETNYQQTRTALAETARRIVTLQNKLVSLPERTTTQIRNSDNPELLGKMKSRLLELQLKRTELLTKYEPSYRLVQEVDQQIAETKAALAAEDQAPLRDETTQQDANREWAKAELLKAQVEFNGLQSRAASMGTQLTSNREAAQRLGDRAIQQEDLVRAMKAAEEKYLLYANKREEARIGDALDENRMLDVSLAEQPAVPALPVRTSWNFGVIGLFLASAFSTGFVFISDYLDPSFRTPDEVLAYLGTPVLASLPQRNS